jgi:hypothetical protein
MANINPIKIFQKDNVQEEYYVFSGYVKSVTDQGSYNSVSFKVNAEDSGIDAPLISVMCFEQKIGVNHKKLVESAKGRFVTIFAVSNIYKGKVKYIARHIVLAPREFTESTNPIIDETPDADIPEQVAEPETESEQLPF